jgi:phosphoglycerate dehydrogenase-like enzyme
MPDPTLAPTVLAVDAGRTEVHGMTDNKNEQTTLVLGGTGKTGRRIVQRLQAKGVPVRVGTPSATPPFDWTDAATWPAALDGVGSV